MSFFLSLSLFFKSLTADLNSTFEALHQTSIQLLGDRERKRGRERGNEGGSERQGTSQRGSRSPLPSPPRHTSQHDGHGSQDAKEKPEEWRRLMPLRQPFAFGGEKKITSQTAPKLSYQSWSQGPSRARNLSALPARSPPPRSPRRRLPGRPELPRTANRPPPRLR